MAKIIVGMIIMLIMITCFSYIPYWLGTFWTKIFNLRPESKFDTWGTGVTGTLFLLLFIVAPIIVVIVSFWLVWIETILPLAEKTLNFF